MRLIALAMWVLAVLAWITSVGYGAAAMRNVKVDAISSRKRPIYPMQVLLAPELFTVRGLHYRVLCLGSVAVFAVAVAVGACVSFLVG